MEQQEMNRVEPISQEWKNYKQWCIGKITKTLERIPLRYADKLCGVVCELERIYNNRMKEVDQ